MFSTYFFTFAQNSFDANLVLTKLKLEYQYQAKLSYTLPDFFTFRVLKLMLNDAAVRCLEQ